MLSRSARPDTLGPNQENSMDEGPSHTIVIVVLKYIKMWIFRSYIIVADNCELHPWSVFISLESNLKVY